MSVPTIGWEAHACLPLDPHAEFAPLGERIVAVVNGPTVLRLPRPPR